MPIMGKTKKDILLEFRTTEILEAARVVFAKKGFHDATVDDIAEAAGVAKGTVYLYYRSKREIYFEALKFGIASMNRDVQRRVREAKTAEDKLRALIATKMEYCDRNRDFFRIYYSELGKIPLHPSTMDTEITAYYLEQAKLVEFILVEGIRKRVIRKLPTDRAAFAISDAIRGVVTQRILGWSKSEIGDDIDFLFDLVWKGIAAS